MQQSKLLRSVAAVLVNGEIIIVLRIQLFLMISSAIFICLMLCFFFLHHFRCCEFHSATLLNYYTQKRIIAFFFLMQSSFTSFYFDVIIDFLENLRKEIKKKNSNEIQYLKMRWSLKFEIKLATQRCYFFFFNAKNCENWFFFSFPLFASDLKKKFHFFCVCLIKIENMYNRNEKRSNQLIKWNIMMMMCWNIYEIMI